MRREDGDRRPNPAVVWAQEHQVVVMVEVLLVPLVLIIGGGLDDRMNCNGKRVHWL